MTDRIGFIGLGTMGAALALRLARAGYAPVLWNRSPGRDEAIIAAGGRRAATAAQVLAESDIVCSMLANDTAVLNTFDDAALAISTAKLHINLATVSLDAARELAARHRHHGLDYVAAPVLGRPDVGAAGALNIIAGGAAAAIERAEPLLSHLGKRVWRVGDDPAHASLVKIGVNYTLIHALQALGESLSLVEHGGVDASTFVDILTDTSFTGSAYVGYGGLIARRQYTPAAFSVELGLKDLGLAESAATELGAALPTAPVMRDVFTETLADEALAASDWSAIAEVIRRRPPLDG